MAVNKKILITGGAGFIGSHLVRRFVNNYSNYHIYNLDVLNYAGKEAAAAYVIGTCQIGGQVGIVGHISIGNNVKIQAQSGISKNVPDNALLQGTPAFDYGDFFKSYVHFKNLPQLAKKIGALEKKTK